MASYSYIPLWKRKEIPIAFAVISIVYGLLYAMTPITLDDIEFSYRYINLNNGDTGFSVKALMDFGVNQWQIENGRLANIISPVFNTILPHCIASLLLGILAATMITLGASLSIPRPLTLKRLIVFWIFCIVLLPWNEYMLAMDYSLNYPVTMTIQLLFIRLLFPYTHTYNPKTQWKDIALPIVAFIAGWSHEGFSMPMCVALAAVTLYRRFRMPGRWWIAVLMYSIGTAIAVSSPGIWFRAGMDGAVTVNWANIRHLFVSGIPAVVMAGLLTALSLSCRKGRHAITKILKSSDIYILISVALVANVILAMLTHSTRGAWMADVYSIMLIFALTDKTVSHRLIKYPKSTIAASMLLLASYFAGVFHWQYRMLKECHDIMPLIQRSQSGTVYHDVIHESPWYTLGLPYVSHWRHLLNSASMRYTDPSHRLIAVVPASFKDWDNSSLIPIAGNADACYLDNTLIMRHDGADAYGVNGSHFGTIHTIDRNGITRDIYCQFIAFYNVNGEKWNIVVPTLKRHRHLQFKHIDTL